MRVAFTIGTNDVGGAEYVSYQHVLMAHRAGMDMVVLSGTTGKFYDLLLKEGVIMEVIGLTPSEALLEKHLTGADVVFNCNFFGILPQMVALRNRLGFAHCVILHNDTNWVLNNVIKKYDHSIDMYYSIHQRIVDAFVSGSSVSAEKFVVIPNCVDYDLINAQCSGQRDRVRESLGIAPAEFVIGMVTRVAADKNILDALRIFRALPAHMRARLLIVGGAADNPGSISYHSKVISQIKADPILKSKVIVTGNRSMEEVYTLISAFDLGLNCSPSEGLPIAMLEMMAAGVVCVMPSVGDISAVLTSRGLVVPIRQRKEIRDIFAIPCYSPQEIRFFTTAIMDLFNNRARRLTLSGAAREFIAKNRSLSVQEIQLFNFFDMTATKQKRVKATAPVQAKEQITSAEDVKLPKVSVLMPTRDATKEWICLAIESILSQDYQGEMELVIVGHDIRMSMIRFIDYLQDLYKTPEKNPRNIPLVITFVESDEMTFSQVLDHGVGESSGEIIVRMDHDDVAYPALVSSQVDFLLAHPNIHVCGVQIRLFDAKQSVTAHPLLVTREVAYNSQGYWFVNHPGVAMRRETLLKVGGYGNTPNGYAEDYTLWCKFLQQGFVIANLSDVLMDYRVYDKRVRPADFMAYLQKQKNTLRP